VSREETARNIVRDASRFTVEKAKSISQELLNNFIESWKHIFNVMTVKGANDSAELFRECREKEDSALQRLLHDYRKLSRELGERPFTHILDEAINLMEEWAALRNPQQFFETIVSAREEAANLFDQCKSVKTFADDQFDNYKACVEFYHANHDNFAFLTEEQRRTMEALKKILSDQEPWEHIPSYLKMMRTLKGQLGECRTALIGSIKEKYHTVFTELEKYADSVNVKRESFAAEETTIARLTASNNLYALKASLSTESFYNEQMACIDRAIPALPTPSNDSGTPAPKSAVRTRRMIHLNTHTPHPLRTEDDVNQYLQSLKEQIMRQLGDDHDIIVS
jgi:hypothetical protein